MLLALLGAAVLAVAAAALLLSRDGELITPGGSGMMSLPHGEFEVFTLPDYAARMLTPDYRSYLIEVDPGIKVHVLEVGAGFPVFLMHGNPTSGFLYRRVAAELPTDRLRLIMPTLVGLGFSSKVPASMHTLENHTRWINTALAKLKLGGMIYVGQDWGGPVGMGALALSPRWLKGLVVMNTGFTAPEKAVDLSRMHALVKRPLVGELMVETFRQPFQSLPRLQGNAASLSDDIIELYARPVLDSGNRKAPLALMRMVPDGPDHPSAAEMRRIGAYVAGLEVPAEIVWGMNDPILASGLPAMQALFPDAPTTKTDAGHFLQEEVPGEIAAAILRLVDRL
jgi:haloalkane dehalogenase